jgi:hypothetical protein
MVAVASRGACSDYLIYLLNFSVNAIGLFLATWGKKPYWLRIILVLVPSLLLPILEVLVVFIAEFFALIMMAGG